MRRPLRSTVLLVGLAVATGSLGYGAYRTHTRLAYLERNSTGKAVLASLRAEVGALTDSQARLREDAIVLDGQLQTLNRQYQARAALLESQGQEIGVIKAGMASTASQQEIAALADRLNDLAAELSAVKARPVVVASPRPAPPPPSPRPRPKPAIPKQLTPPFTPLGIESRGGERFLSVSPLGSSSLGQVRLLGVGDRFGSWRLQRLDLVSAEFRVEGHADQILMVR